MSLCPNATLYPKTTITIKHITFRPTIKTIYGKKVAKNGDNIRKWMSRIVAAKNVLADEICDGVTVWRHHGRPLKLRTKHIRGS